MRFGSLYLKNYIGIYNGMGLDEIMIDFTRCKFNTVIIRGDNGSGKSTIMKALQMMPDPNESFIPGLPAVKELVLLDGPVAYKLRFIHAIKPNGERDTTKAYISKTFGGQIIELNENGNIGSYKDILYTELKLDANFVALSQLSLDDRGLADKKPAERKKFVNSIIDSLDVYNDIYKTLNKRASNFKSMINSIAMKLDKLGDPEGLKSTIVSLDNRIARLNAEKNDAIEQIAMHKANIATSDPNGSIQQTYTEIEHAKKELDKALTKATSTIENLSKTEGIYTGSSFSDQLAKVKQARIDAEFDAQIIKNDLSTMLGDREVESNALQSKVEKLKSLECEKSEDDLLSAIDNMKQSMSAIESILYTSVGIKDILSITKDEYIFALETLKGIKETIDSFRSNTDYNLMNDAIEICMNNQSYPDVNDVDRQLADVNQAIINSSDVISKLNADAVLCEKLSIRPTACKIDSCGFIADALSIVGSDPKSRLADEQAKLESLESTKKILTARAADYREITTYINSINSIIRSIKTSKSILMKLPNTALYADAKDLFKRFASGDTFEYLDTLYSYIGYANLFEEYNADSKLLATLENEYKVFQSKNEIILEITHDIDSITEKLNGITEKIYSMNKSIAEKTSLAMYYANLEPTLSILVEAADQVVMVTDNIAKNNKDRLAIAASMSSIQQSIATIDAINAKIISLSKELQPTLIERDKTNHAIQSVNDYREELQSLSQQYEFIETIKFYSSPTTGIQLVFMELYMGKIITLANELLGFLFNGKFTIQPFVINETEFRIPCLGDGLMNDDISSMSSAQIAMISMILSFALLHNSSTKYNIIKLDEIDGPLDETNRIVFIDVLYKIMGIMQTEQCIIISHNSELQVDTSDVILLKMDNNFSSDCIRGNVIWKYN